MLYQAFNSMRTDLWKLETGENFVFPPHLHASFEWIAVTEGTMSVTVDKKQYSLRSGDALLVHPNQVHSFDFSEQSRHILCIFSPALVKEYMRRVQNRIPIDNSFRPTSFYTDRLLACATHEAGLSDLEIKGILYALIGEFDTERSYRERRGENDLLQEIFYFVENNYDKDCSLSALSSKLLYHYVYLSRYFKQCTGISFTEYVNFYRINEAAYLLKNSHRTVLDIACDCGFESLRSFNRNFKAVIGATPSAYREQGIKR